MTINRVSTVACRSLRILVSAPKCLTHMHTSGSLDSVKYKKLHKFVMIELISIQYTSFLNILTNIKTQ